MSEEFVCKVCGCPVSKRKSLAYKDGRACRSHQEVQDDASERQRMAAEKARRERDDVKRMMDAPANVRDIAARMELLGWMDAHCWACGAEGFTVRTYAERMLIGMEKMRIKGQGFSILDFSSGAREKLLGEAGLSGVPLAMFPPSSADQLKRRDVAEIVRSFGIILLCRECAGKTGREDFDGAFMPKISYKSVVDGMALAAAVGPAIEGIAAGEIRRQAEQN